MIHQKTDMYMSPTYPFYWKENKAVMPLLLFLSYIS